MTQHFELAQTMVATDEGIFTLDTLIIGNQRWIVPEWIDGYPTQGFSRPAYMIRVDLLPGGPSALAAWVVHGQLPAPLLRGESVPGFQVVHLPDHFVEIGEPGEAH